MDSQSLTKLTRWTILASVRATYQSSRDYLHMHVCMRMGSALYMSSCSSDDLALVQTTATSLHHCLMWHAVYLCLCSVYHGTAAVARTISSAITWQVGKLACHLSIRILCNSCIITIRYILIALPPREAA